MFQQMFPGTTNVPAPYLMPSTEHFIDETEVGALFELLMEKGMLDKLVSKFGYQKAKGHEDEVKETQLRPTKEVLVKDGAKDTKCKECNKSFRRACELR